LKVIETQTGKNVYTILQLRLHPALMALKESVSNGPKNIIYDLDLTYITSRGKWYQRAWKGDISKSGGIATNIGVHFFDMLSWIFGDVQKNTVHVLKENKAAGFLQLEKARVRWVLSLEYDDIPAKIKLSGKRTYRSLIMDGKEIEFSDGFTDLHTVSYQDILNGKGFRLTDAKPSINIVYHIRNAKPIGLKGDYHPLLKDILK